LEERSADLISIDFTDQEERKEFELRENTAYVNASELMVLVERWGTYRSETITETRIQAWLHQFGNNQNQRLMFYLLQSLRFYSETLVREKLRVAMQYIKRKTIEVKKPGMVSRRDVYVSYLGSEVKSGTQYARMFCQENDLLKDSVLNRQSLITKIKKGLEGIQAVVFVEDFVGSGETIIGSLRELDSEIGDLIRHSSVKFFIVAVCGFEKALNKIDAVVRKLEFPLELFCVDVLSDADVVFSNKSAVFPDSIHREKALLIAKEKGESLEKKHPLGFGDCQSVVVFLSNCPNNTHTILYNETDGWMPLFPRL
jgi:hypothetical protein